MARKRTIPGQLITHAGTVLAWGLFIAPVVYFLVSIGLAISSHGQLFNLVCWLIKGILTFNYLGFFSLISIGIVLIGVMNYRFGDDTMRNGVPNENWATVTEEALLKERAVQNFYLELHDRYSRASEWVIVTPEDDFAPGEVAEVYGRITTAEQEVQDATRD